MSSLKSCLCLRFCCCYCCYCCLTLVFLLGKFIWYTHIVSFCSNFYSYFTKSIISFYLIFFLFLLAFSNLIYYTILCRKVTFYNPLLIIYTPLKRPMAPPSVFYFPFFSRNVNKAGLSASYTKKHRHFSQCFLIVCFQSIFSYCILIAHSSFYNDTFILPFVSAPPITYHTDYDHNDQYRNKNRC